MEIKKQIQLLRFQMFSCKLTPCSWSFIQLISSCSTFSNSSALVLYINPISKSSSSLSPIPMVFASQNLFLSLWAINDTYGLPQKQHSLSKYMFDVTHKWSFIFCIFKILSPPKANKSQNLL